MELLPPAFRLNAPDVLAESVDGEVLIINLVTGVYYTARGTGDCAWQLLEAGHGLESMVQVLAGHFGADHATIAADMDAWLRELIAEEIVIGAEAGAVETVSLPPAAGAWTAPALEKYTDMQDLLILDPVHEVAAEGWPKAAGVS